MLSRLGSFFITFMLPAAVVAQSVGVVSYYPTSAYVTERLLPFTIGDGEGVQVRSVSVTRGESCLGIVDPYHGNVFHLYCRQPDVLSAQVIFADSSGRNLSIDIDGLVINGDNVPGSTEVRAFGGDAE